MTLYIRSPYHDFYIRGMQPLQHYWPIRENSKCTSLKFAVDWGNNHTDKAQAMGEAASNFIQEDLKMDYVYDYMFHLLNEYAKLFKYKPTVSTGAVELCAETMACQANGAWRNFMVESMVKSPSETIPCSLPPYDPHAAGVLLERKASSTRQVEMWENEYWKNLNNKKQ
ncbi:Lipopolysaccharide-modifying protein [Parasponia andersonii]|uniref:Lipopolysaccharide-modifying protein n=1 Tax=Parasponia andersonii TaxID=3476 RepID=A0A2P5B2R7_PARAD|nr:Lipopolysaccharide-modifying protein [Parasponia andersonii]